MADFDYVSQADATEPSKGPKPPLDLSHHFSRVTAARQESQIKEFYKYFMIPGIGNLAGGKFNLINFPPASWPKSKTTMLIPRFRTPQRLILPIRYARSPNCPARAF
jgi:hypothetical protein